MAVNWRSSGLAMLDASVSGSPPGRPAPTQSVGKSMDGRSLIGSAAEERTPNNAIASMSGLVAIGRRTNGSETFKLQNSSHYLFIVKRYAAGMPKKYGQSCPVARSLEFLGERWTLRIVRDLLNGPRKFQDVAASLGRVAPTVLSHRLKVLETHGIVSRRLHSQHPPRAEYALTDGGIELRPVVRALGIWGARHLGAAWTFVHEACGANVEIA